MMVFLNDEETSISLLLEHNTFKDDDCGGYPNGFLLTPKENRREKRGE